MKYDYMELKLIINNQITEKKFRNISQLSRTTHIPSYVWRYYWDRLMKEREYEQSIIAEFKIMLITAIKTNNLSKLEVNKITDNIKKYNNAIDTIISTAMMYNKSIEINQKLIKEKLDLENNMSNINLQIRLYESVIKRYSK